MQRYRKSGNQIRLDNQQYINQCVTILCADGDFTHEQRTVIRAGLTGGLSLSQVELYARPEFKPKQMEQIRRDLRLGIPFSDIISYIRQRNPSERRRLRNIALMELYNRIKKPELPPIADPPAVKDMQHNEKSGKSAGKNNEARENQIQRGLKNKKVARGERLFSDPSLSVKQIIQIQVGLENGLPIEKVEYYAHRKFSDLQMAQIRRGFEAGLSETAVALYARVKFNNLQMIEIRKGLEDGLAIEDVKEYATPHHTAEEMRLLRETLTKHTQELNAGTVVERQLAPTHLPTIELQSKGLEQEKEIQSKNDHSEQPSLATKYFFSKMFIGNLIHRNPEIWATWIQSKQVYIFEDTFAASILANSAAAEDVQCEVLSRSPYTSCYIIGKGEDGKKLEFFAELDNNVLRFQQMQNEEVVQSCEMRVGQYSTGRDMLVAIEDLTLRDNATKMLQLYICLCSAEAEEASALETSNPVQQHRSERTRSLSQGIPLWDVDIYTVTMRMDAPKIRRIRSGASDGTSRRSHKRRAHWHHFWTGSRKDEDSRRLIVKWVPEIDVNPTEQDLPVRIILVRNANKAE